MAPLPSNNTPVLYVQYRSGGQSHTANVRLPSNATSATALTAATALRDAMRAGLFTTDSITGAKFRAAGSNVSLPVGLVPAAGTNAGTPDDDLKPGFMSYTGRSADGRDVRFTLFTRAINPKDNGYRSSGLNSFELALLNVIQGSSVDARTISGLTPVWNGYVNYGLNAYYQRKARRS